MSNIREHCSWVHPKEELTTEKAKDLVRMMVEKVKKNNSLQPIKVPVTKTAIVVGGGVAGIQAALDIANCGHKVIMVEKNPSIGGHMSQLSETFPTLDCSQCILTPRMVEVAQHPNITLYSYAEVESVEGFIGNFKVKIRKKSKSLDESLCTGCGLCTTKCPNKKIPNEFERGLASVPLFMCLFHRQFPTNRSSTGNIAHTIRKASAVSVKKSAPPRPFALTSPTRSSVWMPEPLSCVPVSMC